MRKTAAFCSAGTRTNKFFWGVFGRAAPVVVVFLLVINISSSLSLKLGAESNSAKTTVKTLTSVYDGKRFESLYLPAEDKTSPFFSVLNSRSKTPAPILLIPPIGVGISNQFFTRFINAWKQTKDARSPIYAPDLIGCGTSVPMPTENDKPLTPADWGEQLSSYIKEEIGQPVILVSQGGSAPIALSTLQLRSDMIKGLILLTPPNPKSLTTQTNKLISNTFYSVFSRSILGDWFYRIARGRAFLKDFSEKNLFLNPSDVDDEWLDMCSKDAVDFSKRFGIFAFLSGIWRDNYKEAFSIMAKIPTLVVAGSRSSFDPSSQEKKLSDYKMLVPSCETTRVLQGGGILPWECPEETALAIQEFISSNKL